MVHGGARDPVAGPCHTGMAESDRDQGFRLLVHREHGWPRPRWIEKPMRPVITMAPVSEKALSVQKFTLVL